MEKYIRFKTGDTTTQQIPVGRGLFAEEGATALEVKVYCTETMVYHYSLTTTGADFDMVAAIQDAVVEAAQTSWLNPVVDVAIPSGQTVTAIAVTGF